MAENVTIDMRELHALMRRIDKASKRNPQKIKLMFKKIGTIIQGRAKKYAPRSMTKSEYTSTLQDGVTLRDTSSFTSKNLKNSITLEVKKDRVEIGVPSNSPAGKYAEKMHDEKGQTWKQVGWQNDGNATDKYIFKAYLDSEKELDSELNSLLDQIIREI